MKIGKRWYCREILIKVPGAFRCGNDAGEGVYDSRGLLFLEDSSNNFLRKSPLLLHINRHMGVQHSILWCVLRALAGHAFVLIPATHDI